MPVYSTKDYLQAENDRDEVKSSNDIKVSYKAVESSIHKPMDTGKNENNVSEKSYMKPTWKQRK